MIFEKYKNKIWPILSILFVILVVGFISNFNIGSIKKVNNFAYVFSAGDGSSGNPYQITSWTDLNGVRDDLTAYYILIENLCSTTNLTPGCVSTGYIGVGDNWTRIGYCGPNWECIGGPEGNLEHDYSYTFTGNFNGNNHTISDLIVDLPEIDDVALFGWVYTGGVVSNLGLVDGYASGAYGVGGIAGTNFGTISNSYSTGNILATGSSGGFVGVNWGIISNCYSNANISGRDGEVTYIGGFVGEHLDGTIINSYSTGSVADGETVGGFAGVAVWVEEPQIINSFWDTETSGQEIGIGGEGVSQEGVTGKTTTEMKTLATFSAWGADIGSSLNNLNNGYPYLSGTTPIWSIYVEPPFAGGDGSSGDPYLIANWTHLDNVRDDLTLYYKLIENLCSTTNLTPGCVSTGYIGIGDDFNPIGYDQYNVFTGNFDGNNKTISDLIVIPSGNMTVGLFGYANGYISDLGLIDVNMAGTGFYCVAGLVGYQSGGTVDNSYSTGIVATYADCAGGLVGESYGTISNSYSSTTVSGSTYVGGFAASSKGTITNSYSTGSASGNSHVGGLVGWQYSGTISNSYSTASASGGSYAGGLVGRQQAGAVANSYSTGNVIGTVGTGGLVGRQDSGTITNSYSIGHVTGNVGRTGGFMGDKSLGATVSNCFWDTETSEQTDMCGNVDGFGCDNASGKTTDEMNMFTTFSGASWDIISSLNNLNNGYPYLSGTTPIWSIYVESTPIPLSPRRRPTHSACDLQGQCVSVLGAGPNLCSVDMDCVITATTTEQVATTTATTTPIVCSLGNDCGVNNYTGIPFCQDNNVYQNYVNYSCNNASTTASFCSSTTVAQLKTTCLSNQTCISGECVNKIIKHSQCVGLSCVEVDGAGVNTCQNNNDCKIKEIIVCGDNICNQTESCDSCKLDCGECEVINPIVGETPPPTENPVVGDETVPIVLGSSESFFENIKKFFTSDIILEKINIITNDMDEIINSPQGEVVTKTVSTAGAVTVVAVTAGSVSFSISDIILLLIRSFNLLLVTFGLKKRVSPWGIVYDSVTKQPLDPAYVVLKNMKGKEVSSAITDLDGRFGFLVEPGIYQLFAKKTNYIFPSKELFGKTHDALHKDLYFGETVEVKTLGEVIIKNIPLDPVNFDWNEFAKRDKGLMKFYSKWDVVKRKIVNWFFIVCFLLAVVTYYFSPYPYNLAIIILYVFLSLIIIFGLKPKTYGYIKEKETGFPLSFAIVRVFLSGSDTIIASKTTDKYGKYYCLVPPGKYYIKVEKKNDDGSYSTLYTSSDIDVTKKGIINENFRL